MNAASSLKHWLAPALAFFALMAVLPLFTSSAVIAVLTVVLIFALYGQAWNLMMGFVGQLSLGHGLYIGLGAYSVALAVGEYGLSPWLGILIGMAISALAGAIVAFIGFRFSVRGIYFTLLTIAVAELMRMSFDHWSYVGGTGGYFLKAAGDAHPLLSLRGGTTFFYFAFLVLTGVAFACCAALMQSRLGYFWRAIREDEDAARALGVPTLALKIVAVMISAAITSVGGSFYALLSGSLFPDTIMGMRFSIEIIVAPIVGGLGTLFGPIVGALVVVPIGELANHVAQSTGIFGLNTLIYGLLLLAIICFLPDGIWPPIAARLARLRAPKRVAGAAQPREANP